jgi:nucleoside-diphosphate-sugar epimerase
MNKKILVIGGKGFIGSRFISLCKHRCEVFDRDHVMLPPDSYDTIVYLAAEPNLRSARLYPENAFKTMTSMLFDAVKEYSDSHFIFISSSMVYGNWTKNMMNEDDPKAPLDMYGQLKLTAERDNTSRVVSFFIHYIKQNLRLTLKGADNLFDWTFVDDVATGLNQIVDSKNVKNKIYNLTRGKAFSLEHMTKILYEMLDKTPNYKIVKQPDNYPSRGALNISKAIKDFNYKPKFNLKDGIGKMI